MAQINIREIGCIVFDLGSTLVDERTAQTARFSQLGQLLSELGFNIPLSLYPLLYEEAATNFSPSPFYSMIEGLGLPNDVIDKVKHSVIYSKNLECLYDGVSAMLQTLTGRFKLGIIANQSKGTEDRLKQWGVRDCFDFVLSSAEFGATKPNLSIFYAAADIINSYAGSVLMVGDRLDNDIAPARKMGWITARVLQEFHRFQIPNGDHELPDLTLGSILDIARLV
jgi:HAD superfamily hydrolase (TIGR01549 family)